jgi:xanthine dehydrogenase small subunit
VRAALSAISIERPRGLRHALELLASEPRPVPLAGGTDLFVALNAGAEPRTRFLDLSTLSALRGIRVARDHVTIGAHATFREIREHAVIRRRLPALAAAAAEVGGWQIQSRATIAGNIANASPAGDSLPVLLAHECRVRVASVRGTREIAIDEMFVGYRRLALEADELIVSVSIPWPAKGAIVMFRKVGTRRAQSISKVVFCGVLARAGSKIRTARLAFGSVAPVPVRARAAERALEGASYSARGGNPALVAGSRAAMARDIAPIDDIRSDREYRMDIAGRLLEQLLR